MKKIILLIVFIIYSSSCYADISNIIDTLDNPMKVDIANNPVSLNGTYEIDRLVIIANKKIFIDSSDKNAVSDSKGQVTINLNITKNEITSTLKMQMKGSIFTSGSAFAGYNFIFSKRLIPLDKNKNITLEKKTENAGIHYYNNENKLVWEIPFEQDKIIIMILDKESDKIKNLKNSRYMFL